MLPRPSAAPSDGLPRTSRPQSERTSNVVLVVVSLQLVFSVVLLISFNYRLRGARALGEPGGGAARDAAAALSRTLTVQEQQQRLLQQQAAALSALQAGGAPASNRSAPAAVTTLCCRDARHDWADRYWVNTSALCGANGTSVAELRGRVLRHVASAAFGQQLAASAFSPPAAGQEACPCKPDPARITRGIVIPTGGRGYLVQATVLLRTLRKHHNCTLPVQLVWYGADEMEPATFSYLQKEYAPLTGYDAKEVAQQPHYIKGAKLKGFPLKPFALLHAPFTHALLLDSDIVPAASPEHLFYAPEFAAHGNLFWGDIFGEGMFQDEVYAAVGLDSAVIPLLASGKGDFQRYTESGAVLLDRSRHLDVMEWAWWLNAMGDNLTFKYMYGDKDTYGVAFAMAGKPEQYYQVRIPPAGVFTHQSRLHWQPAADRMRRQGGWWLNALMQFAPDATPLWAHRVTGEVQMSSPVPLDEVLTPPLPLSWTMYHMAFAPLEGTAFPALTVLNYDLPWLQSTVAHMPPGSSGAGGDCPWLTWAAYFHSRTHAVPLARDLELERSCCPRAGAQAGAACALPLERPHELGINRLWDARSHGPYSGWGTPNQPLWAVPLNATSAYSTWTSLNESYHWLKREGLRLMPQLAGG